MNPPDTPTITGYPRADVEEFLAAAAVERERLEAVIADAEARVSRARAAVGAHQVMMAMLLESQQELSRIRREAEAEAATIVAAAERDAQAILSGQPTPSVDPAAVIAAAAPPSIDLAADEPGIGDDPDEFFTFLRGALVDEQPLGPAPE